MRTALPPVALGLLQTTPLRADDTPGWDRGVEGQRKADMGNGYFLNPVLAGDRPDPLC
ncbi:MAG: hypothetical protein JW739_08585 [Opitutales bacterium]|nr:hypothetical protein [Opitutales bacterium]